MSTVILNLADGPTQLDRMEASLNAVLTQLGVIMATLADLQAKVEAENGIIESAITLLQGLAQQIRDLQPNQEAIDQLAASIDNEATRLAAAVAANSQP